MSDKPSWYINAHWSRTRTKTGKTTTNHLLKWISYCSWREEQARGQWYDQTGAAVEVDALALWAAEQAEKHPYAYFLLLTTPDGALEESSCYSDALMAGNTQLTTPFDQFRLIVHDNTAHRHAHTLAFADKRLSKKELLAWRNSIEARLQAHHALALEHLSRQLDERLDKRFDEELDL